MTTEKIVDEAIEKTIRKVVARTYNSILNDVTCRAQSQNGKNLEVIAMQSVQGYFVEELSGAQPTREAQKVGNTSGQSPIQPVRTEQNRAAQQFTLDIGLVIAFIFMALTMVIMIVVVPLQIDI